ncbi:MAG: carbonic anhydrase [Pseudomonadota bacterium]
MSENKCRACLIFCMDYRLHEQLRNFIAEKNLDRDGVDVIRVVGAAKNLVRPNNPSEREFVLQQIQTSINLHGIREIYIINHEDCGAYGLENVADSEEEFAVYSDDLRAARTMLKEEFPGVQVRSYFMWLNGQADLID